MKAKISVLTIILLLGTLSAYGEERTMRIQWDIVPSANTNIAGFKVYLTGNDSPVCVITTPEARDTECALSLDDLEVTVTMTALSTTGIESEHSAPFAYSFAHTLPPLKAQIQTATVSGNPLTIFFDAGDSTGSPISYTWYFGDGSAADTGSALNHTFPIAGGYTVRLVISNEQEQHETTTVVHVTEPLSGNAPPLAVLSAGTAVGAAPFNIHFDASRSTDPDNDPLTFSWNFGDGTSGEGIEITHLYLNPGTYNPTLTVTDAKGGTATSSIPVIATAPTATPQTTASPTASITISKKTDYKEGEEQSLEVTLDGSKSKASIANATILQYAWSFGDGATGSGVSVRHLYPGLEKYTARLTVTDSAGKQAQTSVIIDLEALMLTEDRLPPLLPLYKLLLLKTQRRMAN